MRFITILCICSVLFTHPGYTQDASSTTETLSSVSDISSTTLETSPIPSTIFPETLSSVTESITSSTDATSITENISTTNAPVSTTEENKNQTGIKFVNKLSDQIRSILKHFQSSEPTGLPGQNILLDPMVLPNTTTPLSFGTGYFYNMTVHGLSNFTLEAVNMLLDQLEVYIMVHIKKVVIRGHFIIETFFTKSTAPFNITLTNVTAEGTVYLKADADGKLWANKSVTDMNYQELELEAGNSSSAIMNGVGMSILKTTKPYILEHLDQQFINEANKQLEKTPKIPSLAHLSPVDLAILEGRRYVRKAYEPYTIENVMHHESEFLIVNVGPVTIHGLSKFARVGNVILQMYNNSVQLGFRLITGRIKGKCNWYYDFGKVGLVRNGLSLFHIDHIQFEIKVNQSTNLKKTPVIDDFQLELGSISIKMDGNGHFDYVVERVVSLLPDLLRHLIVDVMEESIKNRVQKDILDKLDVEKLVEDNLSLIETYFIN